MIRKGNQQEAGGMFAPPPEKTLFEGEDQPADPKMNFTHLGKFTKPEGIGLGEAARDYVVSQSRNLGNVEVLLGFDGNGNVLADAHGTKHNVGFSEAFSKEAESDTGNAIAHHNHPNSESLSSGDLSNLAAPGLKVMWVHGMDGNSYRAEIPEIVRAQIKDPRKFRDDMPKIADASAWHLYQTVIDPALISGKMTDEEGGRAIVHLRNLALHKSGLINYTSTLALPNEADYADHIAIAARIARNVYKDNNYGREIPADGTGGRTQLSRHIGDLEGTPEIPSQPRSESSRAQGNAGTGEPSNRGEAKGKPPEIKASFSNENLELRGRAQPVRHIGDMGILPEGIGNNTGGRLETSTNQGSGRGNSTPKGKPPEIKGAFGPPPSASRTFGKKFQYTKDELTVLNDQAKALVAKLFGNGVRVEAVEGLPPDVPEHIAAYYDNLHRITVTVHLSP